MLYKNEIKYCYNDVMVKPAVLSGIKSRKRCNPLDINGFLPIFTAPMSTVVNEENFNIFSSNGIIPILPRNFELEDRIGYSLNSKWAAYSLDEFMKNFTNEERTPIAFLSVLHQDIKVLIDIANGHMSCLYEAVRKAKKVARKLNQNLIIMVGNIANPETYRVAAKAEVDFIRLGIGGGQGCLSSSNLGIHYGMASLIDETYQIKQQMIANGADENKLPKIIADGGVRNYSDIIKAKALGADYVMCGGIFAQFEESAGETIVGEDGITYKKFYGMASKEAQIELNGKKTRTSEGVCKLLPVTGTIPQWSENMQAYFRSAMSYCYVWEMYEFNPENVNCIIISENTKNSINK